MSENPDTLHNSLMRTDSSVPATLKEGDRRNVTILFTDMQSYSTLTESMDPEEVDALMSAIFARFERVVIAYGGSVEKYIGDAMVAVFGVPTIHEDDPQRAVHAALEFKSTVGEYGQAFRTGIHSGLITTGRRGEFDVVTGHAMNIAARLQTAAPSNGILVSQSTYEQCAAEFHCEHRPALNVKGIREPVSAYLVLGPRREDPSDDSAFVGRDEVVNHILQWYLRFDPAVGMGFCLTGDPGIGKTRTAKRFIEKIRRFPGFDAPVLFARAQRNRRIPFSLIVDLILNFHHLDPTADQVAIEDAVAAHDGVDRETAAQFAAFVHESTIVAENRSPDNQSFMFLHTIFSALLRRQSNGPYSVIVFIDNGSMMDTFSRDFLAYLLTQSAHRPFFLIADRQPEAELLNLFGRMEHRDLPPLTAEESAAVVTSLWPDHPTDVAQAIVRKAGGNPLFIAAYVKVAKDQQSSLALPTNVRNMFLAAVSTYNDDVRELLTHLSVFQYAFSDADVAYLCRHTGVDAQRRRAILAFLESEDIIQRFGDEFHFRHDVFKQAMYDSLLIVNRKVLHRIVADRMQQSEHPHTVRLLHHLVHSDQYDAAHAVLAAYPNRSIDRALLPYIELLTARVATDAHTDRMELLFMKGAILFNSGDIGRSDRICRELLDTAVRLQRSDYAAAAYHFLTAHRVQAYAFDKATVFGTKALRLYRAAGDTLPTKGLNVMTLLVLARVLAADYGGAEQLLDEMRAAAAGRESLQYHLSVAEMWLLRGDYARALAVLNAVDAGTSRAANDAYQASRRYMTALAYWHLFDMHGLRDTITPQLDADLSQHDQLSAAYSLRAIAAHFLETPELTTQYLRQADFNTFQIQNEYQKLDALRTLAIAYMVTGRRDRAAAVAAEGAAIGLRSAGNFPTFTLLVVLIETRTDDESAAFWLREAALMVDEATTLPPHDRVLFHYFHWRLCADNGEYHRRMARNLLRAYCRALPNRDAVRLFLSIRSLPHLVQDLEPSILSTLEYEL